MNVARRSLALALVVASFSTLPFLTAQGAETAPTAAVTPAASAVSRAPNTSRTLRLALATVFPAVDATNVCPDTPLRLTFNTSPTLGTSGKIKIIDAANNSVVETIDLSSPTAVKTIGGLANYKYYPVIVSGSQATIYLKNGTLAYGRSYYVTIDAGVFKDDDNSFFVIDQPNAWRFAIKPAPPAAGTTRLTIAADGTGDFCTVQGAIDFIPNGNITPTTLFLRKGSYVEMIFFTDKHGITLLGEDRKQSVISYATNERFNAASGNPFGAPNPDPSAASPQVFGNIYHRGVFLAHRVNDLTIANLTVRNTTPQGGSQAEAIILNGTTTARAIIKDVDLYSYQDTLQINGQAYLNNCHIEGDVDFMWGTGPCFFENCTAVSLRSGAYYTQIRNPPTNHGYVYLHCTFAGASGVTGNFLSRVQPSRFPASEVVLLDCVVTDAVAPIGWQFQAAPASANATPSATPDTTKIRFWEFNSRDAAGNPVDASKRLPESRQLRQPGDAALIPDYQNPRFVLGHDWNPKAAPIFATPAEPRP